MKIKPASDAPTTGQTEEKCLPNAPVSTAGSSPLEPAALYICDACNYIYDEASGDPDSGLPPGTRFEDIPDDWMCPVCGVTKRDFRMLKRNAQACADETASKNGTAAGLRLRESSRPGVVIIGAGHAGWAVVRELRARAYQGPITLVSACDAIPYQKPQLSVAQSKGGLPTAWNTAQRDALASQLNVRVLPRTWVITTLHSQQRVMTTRGTLRYCDLVIATGAQARRVAFAGNGQDRLLSLNELDDYRRIQEAINRFRSTSANENRTMRIGIVGAGLVGCELANDFAASGHEVTLLDVQALPLQSRIGSEKAIALCKSLQGIGVHWVGNASIERVDAITPQDCNSHGVQITLKDLCETSNRETTNTETVNTGTPNPETLNTAYTEKTITQHPLQFDLAIACLGVVPRTRLAKASRWACDEKGLKVDPQSLQLDCNVYALGDSVNIAGVTSGTLAPLMAQARCIAARICGQAENYESPPERWILKTPCHPLSFGASVTHWGR